MPVSCYTIQLSFHLIFLLELKWQSKSVHPRITYVPVQEFRIIFQFTWVHDDSYVLHKLILKFLFSIVLAYHFKTLFLSTSLKKNQITSKPYIHIITLYIV